MQWLMDDKKACMTLKTKQNWAVLDEAIFRKNAEILHLVVASCDRETREKWMRKKNDLESSLLAMPDFKLEIRWEFKHDLIPLLHKVTPSDVSTVIKIGSQIRCDTSLGSLEKFSLRMKRRPQSLLLNPI